MSKEQRIDPKHIHSAMGPYQAEIGGFLLVQRNADGVLVVPFSGRYFLIACISFGVQGDFVIAEIKVTAQDKTSREDASGSRSDVRRICIWIYTVGDCVSSATQHLQESAR